MISLAIPAFNHQNLLDITLRTISWQRDELDEVIVVDDGSDPLLRVPSWVRLVRIDRPPSSRGPGAARNKCFEEIHSEYAMTIDSSVLLPPGTIKALKQAITYLSLPRYHMEPDPPELIITLYAKFLSKVENPQNIEEMEEIYQEHKNIPMTPRYFHCDHTGVVMKKEVFDLIGGYDAESFPAWGLEGQDFNRRAGEEHGLHLISFIPRGIEELLYILHNPHDGVRDKVKRDKQFFDKWGEYYQGNICGG